MNGSGGIRALAASVVGWLIALIVAVLAFRFLLGTFGFLLRTLMIFVLIAGLFWVYVRLKPDPD